MMDYDTEKLIGRLRRTKTEHRVRMAFGGMIGIADEDETREVPVNPDGPAAADLIERLLRNAA